MSAFDSAAFDSAAFETGSAAATLAGAPGTQANIGSTGAITQDHNVAGSDGTQANTGSTGTITQDHNPAGAPGTQANIAGVGAITITAAETLAGAPGTQANIGGSGAISQTQAMAGSAGTQANIAGTGAISIATDPRYARPQSTLAAGGWTASDGGDLAAAISEPSADATRYISATAPGSRYQGQANPVADPGPGSIHVMRYQVWSDSGSGIRVYLMQGAVEIASWQHLTLPTAPTIYAQTLTAPQVASITDRNSLRFDFEAL